MKNGIVNEFTSYISRKSYFCYRKNGIDINYFTRPVGVVYNLYLFDYYYYFNISHIIITIKSLYSRFVQRTTSVIYTET